MNASPSSRTREMVTAGLLAALLAASAWLAVPIGSVPVTLQVFVVVLIALVLRPQWAAGAVGTYLLVGAAGLPVFAGGKAGLGVLVGPTGGYLFGFFLGALLGAGVRLLLSGRSTRIVADSAAAAVLILVVYLAGWLQLAAVTGVGLAEAFAMGVAPFILIDVVKAIGAVAVATALRGAGVTPSG